MSTADYSGDRVKVLVVFMGWQKVKLGKLLPGMKWVGT
jgi:hypothetical protein